MKNSKTLRYDDIPKAVPGAASYTAGKTAEGQWGVWMKDTEGRDNFIQKRPNEQAALKSAIRWQEKENKLVKKHHPTV